MVSLEDLEKYCEGKHFQLSEFAKDIYRLIKKNRGVCPFRIESVMCPCSEVYNEIAECGHTLCNLFVRREDARTRDNVD
jgi:ferredoxin-thioredoxin reductase catalytic subunit